MKSLSLDGTIINVEDLEVGNPDHEKIRELGDLVMAWFGVKVPILLAEGEGNFAYPGAVLEGTTTDVIVLDFSEIEEIASDAGLSDDQQWSCVQFVLAHEAVHCHQFKNPKKKLNGQIAEGHADTLAGFCLGYHFPTLGVVPEEVWRFTWATGDEFGDREYPPRDKRVECAKHGFNRGSSWGAIDSSPMLQAAGIGAFDITEHWEDGIKIVRHVLYGEPLPTRRL